MGQTYPAALPDITPANALFARPRYGTAGDWAVGTYGDDVDQATATASLASASGGAAAADFAPRHQAGKAALPGASPPNAIAGEPDFVLAADVTRRRGSIDPLQPYPKTGDTAPAAPVVSSLSPNTAAATALPITVTITGTGFTKWSVVKTGGVNQPDPSAQFVDATHMKVLLWSAAAGSVGVVVEDHDVVSNSVNFTVT